MNSKKKNENRYFFSSSSSVHISYEWTLLICALCHHRQIDGIIRYYWQLDHFEKCWLLYRKQNIHQIYILYQLNHSGMSFLYLFLLILPWKKSIELLNNLSFFFFVFLFFFEKSKLKWNEHVRNSTKRREENGRRFYFLYILSFYIISTKLHCHCTRNGISS